MHTELLHEEFFLDLYGFPFLHAYKAVSLTCLN